jgi:hypothetical protein
VVIVVPNSPSIWAEFGPLTAFAGSLLLFIGAMITLSQTNKRADQREFNKWRRETISKLSADALEHIRALEACYREAMSDTDLERFNELRRTAQLEERRLMPIRETFVIVDAKRLAHKCEELRTAAHSLSSPSEELMKAYAAVRDEAKKVPSDAPDRARTVATLSTNHTHGPLVTFKAALDTLLHAQNSFATVAKEELTNTAKRRR